MKTTKSYLSQLKILCGFFGKIATAIVSGLPKEKIYLKPKSNAILRPRRERFKPEIEKYYHRPMAKPAVEKQTLLKENKKVKFADK